MKSLFVLCACVCASMAAYYYTIPATPCSWSATVEYEGPNTYKKTKHYVFGSYYKSETYNKNGDLIQATAERSDYADKGDSATFSYDGISCSVSHGTSKGRNYKNVIGLATTSFTHINETKYNGQDCMVYYNNQNGVPNVTWKALYVNKKGYVIGKVEYGDDPKRREVYNYSYGFMVTMGDFTFSKSYCYSCSDERIFHNPEAYYAQCTASTSTAAVAVVLAALLAALVSLF